MTGAQFVLRLGGKVLLLFVRLPVGYCCTLRCVHKGGVHMEYGLWRVHLAATDGKTARFKYVNG